MKWVEGPATRLGTLSCWLTDRLSGVQCHPGSLKGTKLGPWLFLLLINDLDVDNLANLRKYVDDTTASEVIAKGNRSCAQEIMDKVVEWSMQNKVKFNSNKCKELGISFVKDEPQFASMVVDGNKLAREGD